MSYLSSALGPVPQSEPLLPGQVPNSAGGHSWAVDDWTRLDRFLVLGSEGGSYYATERKLTTQNVDAVKRCIAADGQRTVRTIVAVSEAGRAPKNDPAILALALALKTGDAPTKALATAVVPRVCRTGTHILHLADFVNQIGGWGRGTKRAFANWYTGKGAGDLGYQLVKYQSRDGWSNRDVLRLAHPRAPGVDHATLFAWATGKDVDETLLPPLVAAFEHLKKEPTVDNTVRYIRELHLPREAIPSQLLNEPRVWEALAATMGPTALIRNLATMTRLGMSDATLADILTALTDDSVLRARVHPIQVLSALLTYRAGKGVKGQHTWTPVPRIVDALDAAFYASFGSVEPCSKKLELALDVSASMTWSTIAGVPGLTPRIGSVAMAMVTRAANPSASISAFATSYIRDLDISPRRRLDDNIATVERLPAGGTDCSLPMLYGIKDRRDVDAFVVYTDSETWAGRVHPAEALREYRRRMNKPRAKLAVVGMVANGFTIADPADPGMLDVVGFDTATPNVLAGWINY